jgi:hypothetical protein
MAPEVLYKYRSLDNWKFIVDILLSQRLYAASFRSLNDPMEGRYHYRGDEVSRAFDRSLRQSKDYWRICSLSAKPTSTLMWSYYGGGHTGVALGVVVPATRGQTIRRVQYDSDVYLGPGHQHKPPRDVALEIFTQKQLAWAHEDEVRVFSPKPFIAIQLRSILLGCQIADADEALLRSLVKAALPKVSVKKLRRRNLDAPLEIFEDPRPAA